MSAQESIPVWLDCDPGHDDALAILLASHSQRIQLLGISIVHGNDTVEHCAKNALRILWACGVKGIPVYKGIQRPLVREPKFCPEIHGIPGEQGVAGMCGYHFPDDIIFSDPNYKVEDTHGVLAMATAIKANPKKVTVVLTGAQTNFAFAIRMYPELKDNIEKVIFMGGAIGLGNTGIAAEFNIQIDPEAASIVFHSGLPLVMIPLEVTHKVLVRNNILEKLANIDYEQATAPECTNEKKDLEKLPHRHLEYREASDAVERRKRMQLDSQKAVISKLTRFSSKFAECFYQLLTFFQTTYCKEFGFESPPLHDPCTIFYLTHPDSFQTLSLYVDVETGSEKCLGRTLCDINSLSKQQPNVLVCTDIDVDIFWKNMLHCLQLASKLSPMNNK
ncbi:Inosine-uridine-preferring nucleoside hydrolase [Orchesella cincta]|uniref:Inosine-uridine-preferring nucleoside hydrolase n=1 Tax=Orchesella cincta TaxID=48709 RepID=A0A1D2N4V6_ORCCI|nr:Inosine-uridine-preferring nucleoside hydrolase [Orchesella cincta]